MGGWRIFLGAAVIAMLVAVAVFLWMDRATPVTVIIEPAPTEMMKVTMTGAVASPGMVSLPPGARLADAAEAAGGFTKDADYSSLNLAGRVGDGEHVVVPSTEQGATTRRSSTSVRSASDGQGQLNINTATLQELDELPGIGEVLAERIVDYRELNGAFSSVDDLVQVDGISLRMVEELRPLITVGPDG